jgi:hypothetical protein
MSQTLKYAPTRPEDGQLTHKGKIYVFRSIALDMGFSPPWLRKYGGERKKHIAINRKVGMIRRWFRFVHAARESIRKCSLFLLSDLDLIKRMRDVAKKLAAENALGPRGDYVKADLLRRQLRDIKAEARQEDSPVEPVVTKQGVEFRVPKFVSAKPAPLDDRFISLPDAARRAECILSSMGKPFPLLTTWHNWTKKKKEFRLIGRELHRFQRGGFTSDGRYFPLRCITKIDFNAVMPRLIEAYDGRIIRGEKTYLSPAFVNAYFELPAGTPASMTLQNRSSDKLRCPIHSIKDGYSADEHNKIQYGHSYLDTDVATLFRKKPGLEFPSMPPVFAPLPIKRTEIAGIEAIHEALQPIHTKLDAQLEKIGAVDKKLDGKEAKNSTMPGANLLTFAPGGFTFKAISAPLGAAPIRILKALHKAARPCSEPDLIGAASTDGSTIEKGTLRGYLSEARNALREAMKKAGVDVADPIPCVQRGKDVRGAWSLVLQ